MVWRPQKSSIVKISTIYIFLMAASTAVAAQIEMFTPQGIVKQIRQVRARFSEPMIPFGDPRVHTEPFDIQCSQKGTQRWADPTNWIYDFDQDLPGGVKCQFALKSGIKTLGHKEIVGQRQFQFSTGGPNVSSTRPFRGAPIAQEARASLPPATVGMAGDPTGGHVRPAARGQSARPPRPCTVNQPILLT